MQDNEFKMQQWVLNKVSMWQRLTRFNVPEGN